MDELTLALRQHSQAFRPADDAFQRVVRRGTRRQRTRRIGSAVVALALFAIVDFGILRGLAPSHTTLTPGGPSDVPSHGTSSDLVVPGSNGHAPYIRVRPTGRGPNLALDPADRKQDHRTTHAGSGPSVGGSSSATTDEDSTPRPMITQSLQMPHGTKGGVNSLDQGARPHLNKVDDAPGKDAHTRSCSARKTPAARARCRAAQGHSGSTSGGAEFGPRLHVTDPGMPTVQPAPPAESGTDPTASSDSAVDGTTDAGSTPADAATSGDETGATDSGAAVDGSSTTDTTPITPDDAAASDAAIL
jgi:hypothetical protein